MNTSKTIPVVLGTIVLLVVGFVLGGLLSNGSAEQLGGTSYDETRLVGDVRQGLTNVLMFQSGEFVGPIDTDDAAAFSSSVTLTGSLVYPTTSVATTTTLTSANFGEIIFINDSDGGTTLTLPAATAGAQMTFSLKTAFDTANIVIDSAEGDNISGTLIVNGAVVACSGEDQINLVNTAETVGDYVTLVSDGISWLIGASTGGAAGGLTCTDPS